MKIGTPVLLVALVVLSVGTVGTVGTDTHPTDSKTVSADSAPKEITECTNITEPGRYVVTQDISVVTENISTEPPESSCIQVNASDVVIDGQGYSIEIYYDWRSVFPLHLGRELVAISVGADDRRLSNVTVKNVESSAGDFGSPIEYIAVDGGTVANVTLHSSRVGVFIANSTAISVRENTIHRNVGPTLAPGEQGIRVRNSSDTGIATNTFHGFHSTPSAVSVVRSTNTTIASNHNDIPLLLSRSTDTTIANNNVELLRVFRSTNTTIANNNITSLRLRRGTSNTVIAQNHISEGGVRVNTDSQFHTANEMTVIENNTITGNIVGVFIQMHNGTLKIQNNELVGNYCGVKSRLQEDTQSATKGTEGVEIHHNVIVNNDYYGIRNDELVTLNATQNYWGASSGPSSVNASKPPLEDPVTGTFADGEGDAVSENPNASGISNVHFDPWLNQSVTNESDDGAS